MKITTDSCTMSGNTSDYPSTPSKNSPSRTMPLIMLITLTVGILGVIGATTVLLRPPLSADDAYSSATEQDISRTPIQIISPSFPGSIGFIALDSSSARPRGPYIPTARSTSTTSPETHTSHSTHSSTSRRTQTSTSTTPTTPRSTSSSSTRISQPVSTPPRSSGSPTSPSPRNSTVLRTHASSGTGTSLTQDSAGSVTSSQPFVYGKFNPCRFTVHDFTQAGLPPLPYKDNSVSNDWINDYSVDDECTYTSENTDNPRWKLVIEKVSYYGVPAEFDWIHPGHYITRNAETVDARKITINGHTAILQEGHTEWGVFCRVGVIPGSWFFFGNHSRGSSSSTTCEMLLGFIRTVMH